MRSLAAAFKSGPTARANNGGGQDGCPDGYTKFYFADYFHAGAAPPGAPASLGLTGWWRAPYFGRYGWDGAESVGSSLGRNLAQSVTAYRPSAGTGRLANYYLPATFDGTNDYLTSALSVSNYFSASAWSIVALINADTAPQSTYGWEEPAIVSDAHGQVSLSFSTAGVTAAQWNGTSYKATAACSTGGWHLAQARFTGTQLQVRVDNGSWSTVSAAGPSLAAYPLRLGANWNLAKYFDGFVAEVLTTNVSLSDSDMNTIRAYVNARYSLSL